MASNLWQLSYNGTTKPLTEWGIEGAQFHRRNLDTEHLTFSITVTNIYADPVFPHNAWLVLYRADVVWFAGRVTTTPAYATGQERQRYVVANAWFDFATIIYQQRYVLRTADFSSLIGSWSTRVVLGQDDWGRKIKTDEQIRAIGAYASSVGSGLGISASFGPFCYPPLETVRDISCAEALRRMLAWTPDAVGSFSYAATGASLSIGLRGTRGTVSLDLADHTLVESISGLTPRFDLLPRGVVLIFQPAERDDSDESVQGALQTRETRQTAGATTGPRVVVATIALANQGTDRAETEPPGLATAYWGSISGVQWEGSVTLHEAECSGTLRVGHRLNLLNGRTAWATMAATVQSTVENLDTGVTEVSLGAGPLLGLGDFAAMMMRFRDRNEAGPFPAVKDNGTQGVDEQLPGTDPTPDPNGDDPYTLPSGDSLGDPLGDPTGAPDVAVGDRLPNTGSTTGGGGGAGGGGGGAGAAPVGGGNMNTGQLTVCNDAGQQVTIRVVVP